MTKLLTPEELSDMLQVPPRTLETWRYRGGGPPCVRVGRHVRYDPDAVRRWLTEQADTARRSA